MCRPDRSSGERRPFCVDLSEALVARVREVVASEVEEAMMPFRSQQVTAEALRLRLLGVLGYHPEDEGK